MSEAHMGRPRRETTPREAEQGRLAQLLSGLAFLLAMLLLFVLSGFRG